MSQASARDANLLGSVGLAVSDRMRAAAEDELGLGGSAPSALVALSTYLADQPLEVIASAFEITPSAVVRLTAAGERRAKAIGARRERVLADVLGALTSAEQRELTRLNEKLLGQLPEDVQAASRVCRFCDPHACGHYEGRCPVTNGIDARGLRG